MELIIAATLVAVASISILSLFVVVRNASNFARNESLASIAAEDAVEDLRNDTFYNIPVGPDVIDFTTDLPADLPEPNSGLIDVTEVNSQLKQIDVTITYQQGSSARSFQYTTFIGIPGLTQ